MKIWHFGFRLINSIPKMLDLNTLTLFLNFFHRSCITYNLNEIHDSPQEKGTFHAITLCTTFTLSRKFCCCLTNFALKKGSIAPLRHASLSRNYANYFGVSRIMPCKNGQSRHHANRCWCLLY